MPVLQRKFSHYRRRAVFFLALARGRFFFPTVRFLGRRFPCDSPPAASSRRRAAAQPGLFTCFPRAIPSAFGGTFSVITEPAAT